MPLFCLIAPLVGIASGFYIARHRYYQQMQYLRDDIDRADHFAYRRGRRDGWREAMTYLRKFMPGIVNVMRLERAFEMSEDLK